MLFSIIFVLLAAGIFVLTMKKKGQLKVPNTLRKGWYIEHSAGVPKHPTPNGSGWTIDFPASPGHLNYVQWYDAPNLKGKSQITARFIVTGGDFVADGYPGEPAVVSIMIQRKGDNLTGMGQMQQYRWYSSVIQPLADGEFQLVAPLTIADWGDIMGQRDESRFHDALNDVDNISLVFGSPGGRGHGVYTSVPSRFTLVSLDVS